MALPYENATSGEKAIQETQKTLRAFGCSSFGHMLDYEAGELLVQFKHRGREISVKASINGYAAAWLKAHPYTYRTKISKLDHERKAQEQAGLSVYSILRDWIKGQVAAIETGVLTFEGAFLGQLLLPNKKTILEELHDRKIQLAPPTEEETK